MLHRSFKPAKCKTALKLAASRIKLLKNKREAQVKQLKREVAHLLESGQDRTARIRVEHVVREEKTVTAYDLIEIYCDLIVARLPIIESQKNCPIDLKEAIASVIFASPRCADIPELMDVRKHFTAKYGKEFVNAAVELRPDCGVNRMLVEKLSAKAPDGQAKLKILTAIAEEHGIKWDPESSGDGDLKPPEDLLNGPSSFEQASKLHVEPPNIPVPPSHNEKGPPNFNTPANREGRHDVPGNFSQNFASTDIGSSNATVSGSSHPDLRASGSGVKEVHLRHPHSRDGSSNWNMEFKDATEAAQAAAESAERASKAARAAAELSSGGRIIRQHSTESHKSFSYSERNEGPQRYASSKLESERLAKDPADNAIHGRHRKMHSEQLDGNKPNNFPGVGQKFVDNSLVNGPPVEDRYSQKNSYRLEKNDFAGEVIAKEQSRKSEQEFVSQDHDEIKFGNNSYVGEATIGKQFSGASFSSHSNIHDDEHDVRKEHSSKSEIEFVSQDHDDLKTGNIGYVGEEGISKQFSRASIRSHSSNLGDDHDVVLNSNKYESGNDAEENPFSVDDEGNIQRDSNKSISRENAAAAFDQSGSDDDDYRFDAAGIYKEQQSSLHFSSPGRQSTTHQSEITSSWSPRQNMDDPLEKLFSKSHISTPSVQPNHPHPVFSEMSESSEVPSKADDMFPATFDDSDGQSSDGEEVLHSDPTIFPSKHDVYSKDPEPTNRKEFSFAENGNVGSNRTTLLQPSLYDSEPVEVQHEKTLDVGFSPGAEKKSVFGDFPSGESSPRLAKSRLGLNEMNHNNLMEERNYRKSQEFSRLSSTQEVKVNTPTPELDDPVKDVEAIKEYSLENPKELNFVTLRGGLRNKVYRRPPYSANPSGDGASLSKQAADDASIESEISSYSSTDEISSSYRTPSEEPYKPKVGSEFNKKPSSRDSVSNFDSHNDAMSETRPLQTFSSSQEPFSKKEGSKVQKNSISGVPITYFDSDVNESEVDLSNKNVVSRQQRSGTSVSRRTRNSDSSVLKAKVLSASVSSDYDAEKNPSLRSPCESQPDPQPRVKHSNPPEISVKQVVSRPKHSWPSSKESLKSSPSEQRSTSSPKISGNINSPTTSSLGMESPSKDNSSKQASHVHPKLPDYDDLAARLQAIRRNQQ